MQARQVLRTTGGHVLEIGPGSGRPRRRPLRGAEGAGPAPSKYLLLEVSPDLRDRQRKLLSERFPQDFHRFVWLDQLPDKIRGFVIANEVLDVVPCCMVHRTGGEILERGVIVAPAGFAFEDQPMPDGDLKRARTG
jgi:SAM-dependent MidA family methyltransferase